MAIEELNKKKSTMTPDDIALEKLRIEELQDKLKRRMLGTIRFIGELFKKGLVLAPAVISCITELLCERVDANDRPVSWKQSPPDIDLEVLCKLIRTVGKELEYQCNHSSKYADKSKIFEDCLRQMDALSRDKSRSSRIRFSLEEVIQLRHNNWIERRIEEGPLKIDEIHRRIEDENRRAMGLPPLPPVTAPTLSSTASVSKAVIHSQLPLGQSQNMKMPQQHEQYGNRSILQRQPSGIPPAVISAPRIAGSHAGSMKDPERMKVTFDDYMTTNSFPEVLEVLSEASTSAVALFVVIAMNKFIETTKHEVHTQILSLLFQLETNGTNAVLTRSRNDIWNEIKKFEQLKILADYVMDNKQVREFIELSYSALETNLHT